jgi:3-dehydroquinate synthetase
LAKTKGLIDETYLYIADDILNKFDFKNVEALPQDKIIKAMKMDKKTDNGKINFILPVDYAVVKEFSLAENEIFN